ncbi:MAG: allantoicase [Pseudomonadota bacterium]
MNSSPIIHDPTEIAAAVEGLINLASPRLGSHVRDCSDEFFAKAERMLADHDPVFIPDKFDDHGKWMDGWETRRRRHGGHDWCLIQLGAPGFIEGVEVDTRHFTGNYPPFCSLQACMQSEPPDAAAEWHRLLEGQVLQGDVRHYLRLASIAGPYRWVRLQIVPDGGIARLRLYGRPVPEWQMLDARSDGLFELSALKNGGQPICWNDAHYGALWTVLLEGRGRTMGEGWETRRRREPGHDWLIIRLGGAGFPREIEIDTAHFKGNYPDHCSVDGAMISDDAKLGPDGRFGSGSSLDWIQLLPPGKLHADQIHRFVLAAEAGQHKVSHIRVNIVPDGGISRVRLFGQPA